MITIDHFNLRSFDLNLLIASDAMMQERSVTRVATRLKIGQPAMSYSLNALRLLFKNELFVRAGQVMQPTARAMVLAAPIKQVLSSAQEALALTTHFDPAGEERTFRVGVTGELELLLLPELTRAWRTIAPNVRIHVRPLNPTMVRRVLDDGVVDLAIGCFADIESWHRSRVLMTETLSCRHRADLLPLPSPLTMKAYARGPHVTITLDDDLSGCLAEGLARASVELNIVSASSSFLAALASVAAAPAITTLPTTVARRYAPLFGLRVCEPPVAFTPRIMSMAWHVRADLDPSVAWLREQVQAIGFLDERSSTVAPIQAAA